MSLRFGEFTLDPDARLLQRGGRTVHLQPKTFELLLLLVRMRPNAVSKSELIDRLWPETFVQEVNLSNLVGELRKALGDRLPRSAHIRTVHGFGYAFAGDVTEDAAPRNATLPISAAAAARLIWGRQVIPLCVGESIVGRDEGVGVVLAETTVSRRHARIVVGLTGTIVEDLSSQNGTWVNERRVAGPTTLNDGDRIRFGGVEVTFRCGVSALTTERLPST
jgi:DNA-binding winged helix-turn-helix (wHTH) protein